MLATGSGAGLPDYVSSESTEKTRGVFVYRNIADLEKIMDYAEEPGVNSVAVVGAGVSYRYSIRVRNEFADYYTAPWPGSG